MTSPPPATHSERAKDLLAFLIPAVGFLEINIIGRLFLTEIALLCSLPYLLKQNNRFHLTRQHKLVLSLAAIWLASQVYTDMVRATPFEDYARGWSKIGFFAANFFAISLLLERSELRIRRFAWGLCSAGIIVYFVAPSAFAVELPWKFGVGQSVTILLVLVASTRRVTQPGAALGIVALAALLNFGLGFRSLGGLCVVCFCFILYARRARTIRIRPTVLVIVGILLVTAISQGYSYLAASGLLGEEQRDKFEVQASGDFGLLLGGRIELFASSQAIIDSPVVGHGSWAKDVQYVELLNERLREYGYEIPVSIDNELVPSHSYLLGAWVESGIAGAIFWMFIFWVTARVVVQTTRTPTSTLAVFILFTGFKMMWDTLFSPFGAEGRITAAFAIAAFLALTPADLSEPKAKRLAH